MSNVLRAAVIGCGRIGGGYDEYPGSKTTYTHAAAYSKHPLVRLVGAADNDPWRLESFCQRWVEPRAYTDYRAMLEQEKPDVISVCTPDEIHHQVVMHAARSGVRAIFCEKPLATRYQDALEMVEECQRRNVALAVNHTRRWDSGHRKVGELISQGELGRIQLVRCLYHGGMLHVGVHVVDILRLFFGEVCEIRTIRAKHSSADCDIMVDVLLEFDNGVACILQGCNRDYYDILEIDIIGAKGRVQINDFGLQILSWRVKGSREYPGDRELRHVAAPFRSGMRHAMLRAVGNLVDNINSGKRLLCSGGEALKTMAVVERILEEVEKEDSGQWATS